MPRWLATDIAFDVADRHTDHPIITVSVATPAGDLLVMSEPERQGTTLILHGVDMHGERTGANSIDAANLMVLALAAMEQMNVEHLVVAGAPRTSGAGPGHRPRAIRFARRAGTDAGRQAGGVEDRVGRAYVLVPVVEDAAALTAELATHGVAATVLPDGPADVRAIRRQPGLTQEQFALRFGLDVAALRNWEAGRREPDTATRSYLRVIQRAPAQAEDALWAG